jgi:hypothetical protein
MDALAILNLEHRLLIGSMAVIARSTQYERRELITRFKRQVEIHNRIEIGVFYASFGADESLADLPVNRAGRQIVEKSLKMLACHPTDAPDWFPYFNTTREMLIRHMDEEEQTCFFAVRDRVSRPILSEIGRSLLNEKVRLDARELVERTGAR